MIIQIPQSANLNAIQLKPGGQSPSSLGMQPMVQSNYYQGLDQSLSNGTNAGGMGSKSLHANSVQRQSPPHQSFFFRNKKKQANIVRDNKLFPNDFFLQNQHLQSSPAHAPSSSSGVQSFRNQQNEEQASLQKHHHQMTNEDRRIRPIVEQLFEQQQRFDGEYSRRAREFQNDLMMPNQLLHLSMDSDHAHKSGLAQSRRLPFGQLESTKNRNYAGSPPPVLSQQSNHSQPIHYRNGENFVSGGALNSHSLPTEPFNTNQFINDQLMRMSNHFTQKKNGLPGLRSSVTQNQQQIMVEQQENQMQFQLHQLQNYQQSSITPPQMSNRVTTEHQYLKAPQRVPLFMRHSQMREDLEQSLQQSHNQQSNVLRNYESEQILKGSQVYQMPSQLQSQNQQLFSYAQQFTTNNTSVNNNNESSSCSLPRSLFFNRIESEDYLHGSPKLNENSIRHQSLNISQHLYNNNHHQQWNRSPQNLRDLDSNQNFNNPQFQFPQTTRNGNLQRSPESNQNTEKVIKFPNIFNHNNQGQFFNFQSLNTSTMSKKGGIGNLDQNYHILKNVKEPILSEQESFSQNEDSIDYENLQQPMKKFQLDRKVLTSRDQETRWLDQNTQLNRVQSKSKLEHQVKDQKKSELSRKTSPLSQSGACWYSQKEASNLDCVQTFGPNLLRESQPKKHKSKKSSTFKKKKEGQESQSRFSVPDKKCSSIVESHSAETKKPKQEKLVVKKRKNKVEKSSLISISELETPNFKQQQSSFADRRSLLLQDPTAGIKQVKLMNECFSQRVVDSPQNTSRTRETLHKRSIEEEENEETEAKTDTQEAYESQSLRSIKNEGSPPHHDKQQDQKKLQDRFKLPENIRGRSPDGAEGEIKKFKVVPKMKKRELTQETKQILLKQLEKNLKKIKMPATVQHSNQENQSPAPDHHMLDSKDASTSNNSQIRKIPVIKKSQIQNKNTEQQPQKIQITRQMHKLGGLAGEKGMGEASQQKENEPTYNNQHHESHSHPKYYQASHQKRMPLTSIENQHMQQPSMQVQIQNPNPTHIQQIYMAAQIPQEFNGMITFMNIGTPSNPIEQNNENDQEQFKNTGGSLMQGTMISLAGSNKGSGNGSNGSCNNSIIMLRSESNYMTSDFGQLGGSPHSTQHLVIMQQQFLDGATTTAFFKREDIHPQGHQVSDQNQVQYHHQQHQAAPKLEFQNSKLKKPANSKAGQPLKKGHSKQ